MRRRLYTRHNERRKAVCLLAGMLILVPILLECCSNKSILGRWRMEEGDQVMVYEFREDGSFTLYQVGGALPGIPITGKYHIQDDQLYLYHGEYRVDYRYAVRGGQLALYDEENQKSVWKKE